MGAAGGRVLVAEANRRAREVISACLRRDGFQVLEAGSGLEALLVLRRGTVDIALIDPMLPEIDGLELVCRVRRESTVPIIMLTAGRDEATRFEVELERARAQHRLLGLEAAGTAQLCTQAGGDLQHRQRLDHIVIGAGVEPRNARRLVAAGGQHDDRDRRLAPDATNQLQPVDLGQHRVDEGDVDRAPAQNQQRLETAARLQDLEPVPPQARCDHVPNAAIGLGYQNAAAGGAHLLPDHSVVIVSHGTPGRGGPR